MHSYRLLFRRFCPLGRADGTMYIGDSDYATSDINKAGIKKPVFWIYVF